MFSFGVVGAEGGRALGSERLREQGRDGLHVQEVAGEGQGVGMGIGAGDAAEKSGVLQALERCPGKDPVGAHRGDALGRQLAQALAGDLVGMEGDAVVVTTTEAMEHLPQDIVDFTEQRKQAPASP